MEADSSGGQRDVLQCHHWPSPHTNSASPAWECSFPGPCPDGPLQRLWGREGAVRPAQLGGSDTLGSEDPALRQWCSPTEARMERPAGRRGCERQVPAQPAALWPPAASSTTRPRPSRCTAFSWGKSGVTQSKSRGVPGGGQTGEANGKQKQTETRPTRGGRDGPRKRV